MEKSGLRPKTHVPVLIVHSLAAWHGTTHRISPAPRFLIKEIREASRVEEHLKELLRILWFFSALSVATISSVAFSRAPPPNVAGVCFCRHFSPGLGSLSPTPPWDMPEYR